MSHAATLHQISEATQGERRRRATAGAMVLRATEQALSGDAGCEFALLRAGAEVESLPSCAEKSILRRVLLLLGETESSCGGTRLSTPLVQYACELETTHRLPEADAILGLARTVSPVDPEIALHAGRLARKLGERERALVLYRTARDLDGEGGTIARLAAIGEAVVSDAPDAALGRVIRYAVRAEDAEAAAVGLEERAAVRRAAGKRQAAARDLCVAAARFADPVDRARVAHELADIIIGVGDPLAAREALLVALSFGDAPQRDHARTRLHTLSRDLGDQVGMRRWRSFKRPSLVSLSAYGRAPATRSAAPVLARWRENIESLAIVSPV
jgi:hypothetical protein